MRADAQRNRAELLDAARLVIAEQGVDASLRDIARRAGVGIGTLYRHFPTREALLAALVGNGVDRMCALAADLAATRTPVDALGTWLSELARRWGPYKGLPGSLLSAVADKHSDMHDTCDAMVEAGRGLFETAQSSGEIRPDVTWDEVFTAISWAAAQSTPERADRILALVLDGLRPAPQ